jgi:hypothetical protein
MGIVNEKHIYWMLVDTDNKRAFIDRCKDLDVWIRRIGQLDRTHYVVYVETTERKWDELCDQWLIRL